MKSEEIEYLRNKMLKIQRERDKFLAAKDNEHERNNQWRSSLELVGKSFGTFDLW